MPIASVNGTSLYYTVEGRGPETVLFGHGYLMTHRMWDAQVAALRDRYRCVRWDWRGQGQSSTPALGYDPWVLAADALRLADSLGAGRFHFVGHSMGGYAGLRLALRQPGRLASLTLMSTGAGAERGAAMRQYTALLWTLRLAGYAPVLGRVMPILYGSDFLSDPARRAEVAEQRKRIRSNGRRGIFRAGQAIFDRDDVTRRVRAIATPTLVVTGEHDGPHPPEHARALAKEIPGAELIVLSDTGHTPPVERPEATTRLLRDFLGRHPA